MSQAFIQNLLMSIMSVKFLKDAKMGETLLFKKTLWESERL